MSTWPVRRVGGDSLQQGRQLFHRGGRSWLRSQMPCRSPATVGRLGQVCQRWISSACLCFALDFDEQQRSGFSYAFSVYQVEYSRNLLFSSGAQMQQLFDRVVDRTRPGWTCPRFNPRRTPTAIRDRRLPRWCGIDLNKPRTRHALTAVLALATTPAGSPSGQAPSDVNLVEFGNGAAVSGRGLGDRWSHLFSTQSWSGLRTITIGMPGPTSQPSQVANCARSGIATVPGMWPVATSATGRRSTPPWQHISHGYAYGAVMASCAMRTRTSRSAMTSLKDYHRWACAQSA